MAETPRLKFPILNEAQASAEAVVNDTLIIANSLIGLSVESRSESGPFSLGSADNGKVWLLPDDLDLESEVDPEFDGQDGRLAIWYDGWVRDEGGDFIPLPEGFRLWIKDENELFVFDGANLNPLGATAGTFLGLGDSPANYTDAARKPLRVNPGQTAIEYAPHNRKTLIVRINAPEAGDEFPLLRTIVPITITRHGGVKSTAGTNAVVHTRSATNRDDGSPATQSAVTITSASAGTFSTSFAGGSANVAADRWLWGRINSISGTPDWVDFILEYTED